MYYGDEISYLKLFTEYFPVKKKRNFKPYKNVCESMCLVLHLLKCFVHLRSSWYWSMSWKKSTMLLNLKTNNPIYCTFSTINSVVYGTTVGAAHFLFFLLPSRLQMDGV